MVSPQCMNGLCSLCPATNCTHACHNPSQPALFGDPVRPYVQDGQPSAGWSGTDTSKDAEPIRAASQRQVYAVLQAAGHTGATVVEVRNATGLHHGVASGALSVLHQRGHLARLVQKRGRCRVYVLPDCVGDRTQG